MGIYLKGVKMTNFLIVVDSYGARSETLLARQIGEFEFEKILYYNRLGLRAWIESRPFMMP